MKYKAIFPVTNDMGTVAAIIVSDKPMETKEQEALWHYNCSRGHDHLPSLRRLPNGTKFVPISDVCGLTVVP